MWYTPLMRIRDIADRLQIDLIESPRQKPKRSRAGGELKFLQKVLADSGYKLSGKELQSLATNSKTYESFILSATKTLTHLADF
jgi:hypothetical protein